MGKQAPAVGVPGQLIVEWGSRSRALHARLTSPRKISGDSFLLLQPGGNPVTLGWINTSNKANWDTATTTPQASTRNGNDLLVTAQLAPPSGSTLLRLDFELTASAGGKTSVVLAFKQLFTADSNGLKNEEQCAITGTPLVASSAGPQPAPGPFGMRRFAGLHPLLKMDPTKVSVNCEFVDVTALWWSIRHDKVGWYLNPALGGRQTMLRVLGWTGGGPPMIWFAVIPDATGSSITPLSPLTEGAADLVFYRPVPGVNSFAYASTEAGFTDSHHDDTTLRILARYLLSPIPAASFPAIKASGKVNDVDFLADQLQPTGFSPPTPSSPSGDPIPADPMAIAAGYPYSFRPVGLEGAFNRAGGNRILLLPLGSGDLNDTYEGAVMSGLQTTVRSALTLLWNVNAIDTQGAAIPDLSQRELWLAGHSEGNLLMWVSAQRNASKVGRIITFDASPFSSNLASGIGIIRIVNAAHGTLSVFAIVTPNLSQAKSPPPGDPWQGLDDDTFKKLNATGATITVLPSFAQRISFWKPVPVSTPKTLVQYLLAKWPDALLAASAAAPQNWRFLFFHEMAVYGGDMISPSGSAGSPTIRTFFEQALV
jgi:hypothetical protein